ncbi:MAG: 2-C-methyl-D-erythritol 2,4-cyclodiphosphate synthase [Candidatus Omnitrophica bacterium]|nr:2-C-methyl-D-erythritol 2,4-cyclodiphosphate synthase [Candidatus Omnitrophota bacterium]
MRVGLGFDVHRLVKGRELILAGVKIPYKKGLSGVSDADVVFHSLSDAILGALGLGDIGDYFPPQDKKNKGLESKVILKKALSLLKNKKINNLDITLISDKPRLKPYKDKMRESLKNLLKLSKDKINIKIKSQESLLPLSKEAIFCISVVTIF